MYDRLLVPLDGSAFSEQVLPYALGISRASGAPLSLLRVVDGEHQQSEASQYVETLAGKVQAEAKCIAFSGDVAATILEEAERVPRTLIAMSSHGRAGILDAMLGSVAMGVLGRSGGPVLVYQPGSDTASDWAQPTKIDRIVLPLDGTPRAEAMASEAAQAARWLGAQLVVIESVDSMTRLASDAQAGDVMETSYVQSRARGLSEQYGVNVRWEVLHGNADDAICRFVDRQRGTMLAMVTRGDPELQDAVLGNVTAGCLRRSGVPVLVRLP